MVLHGRINYMKFECYIAKLIMGPNYNKLKIDGVKCNLSTKLNVRITLGFFAGIAGGRSYGDDSINSSSLSKTYISL